MTYGQTVMCLVMFLIWLIPALRGGDFLCIFAAMERDIKYCHPRLQNVWAKASQEYKRMYPTAPQPFLTCTHRSPQEQDALYAKGRTVQGKIVTNLRGGQSKHNKMPAEAFDIAFLQGKKLIWSSVNFRNFYAIAVRIDSGLVWGGNFRSIKDFPHYEI